MSNVVLGPTEGRAVQLGGLGVRFMIDAAQSGGSFSLVEHPLAPHTLGAPLHTHQNEDEYSYVLEGEIGVQVGEQIRNARPGELVIKPRGIAHAFWNRTGEPARVLEIISPGGFENYFADMAPLMPPQREEPDFAGMGRVADRYGITMDLSSVEAISIREGLRLQA